MKFEPELALQLLEEDLNVRTDEILSTDTPHIVARKSLKKSLFKKWLPGDSREQDRKAVQLFLFCNDRCRGIDERRLQENAVIRHAQSLLYSYIHSGDLQSSLLDLDRCLDQGRAGPGASRGTRFSDFYRKMFCGNLSVDCADLHAHYVSRLSPRWLLAEKLRLESNDVQLVRGSKLSCVPKNREISRTIATEPSINMFYQLGAGAILEGILSKFFGINLDRQPFVNRWYARQGSIDGSFATIDLSSASDTISTSLVRLLLPRQAFALLDLIRSKYVEADGEDCELHMFSSMGNGFTFPLQTLIFATLIRAYYHVHGIPPRTTRSGKVIPRFSVFGDDIIVDREVYDGICFLLGECGFVVNLQKSYNEGPFRESCGSDYFSGVNIRGVYLRSIRHARHVYSAFNRLSRWSLYHGVSLNRFLLYLKGLADFRPVPFDESDDAGFKLPESLLRSHKRDANGAIRYTALRARPQRVRVLKRGTDGDIATNPDGAIICAIGGYIAGRFVLSRLTDSERSSVVRRKTPSWDFVPYPGLTARDYWFLWSSLQG